MKRSLTNDKPIICLHQKPTLHSFIPISHVIFICNFCVRMQNEIVYPLVTLIFQVVCTELSSGNPRQLKGPNLLYPNSTTASMASDHVPKYVWFRFLNAITIVMESLQLKVRSCHLHSNLTCTTSSALSMHTFN